jgi:hypothetical protein
MENVPFVVHLNRPFFFGPVGSSMDLFPFPSPTKLFFPPNLIRLLLPVKVVASLIAALKTAFSPSRTCTAMAIR